MRNVWNNVNHTACSELRQPLTPAIEMFTRSMQGCRREDVKYSFFILEATNCSCGLETYLENTVSILSLLEFVE